MKVTLPVWSAASWLLTSSSTPRDNRSGSSLTLYSAVDDSSFLSTTQTNSDDDHDVSSFVQNLPPLTKDSKRIVLLRHGETDFNLQGKLQGGGHDLDLNERGHQQAYAVQKALKGYPAQVIASSHLERAYQTADVVQQAFFTAADRPVRVIDHKFGEMRFGMFEGTRIRPSRVPSDEDEQREVEASRRRYLDFQNNILFQNKHVPWPGGGESVAQLEERAMKGLDTLLSQFPHADSFCIVAHGRFNKLLLRHLLGLSGYNSLEQGNACINVLDVDGDGKWKARVINHMDHVHAVEYN